jgi:opacity protein-like surface antigen
MSGKQNVTYTRAAFNHVFDVTTYEYSAFPYLQDSNSSNKLNKAYFDGALVLDYVWDIENSYFLGVGLGIDFLSYRKTCETKYTGSSSITIKTPPFHDVTESQDIHGTVNTHIKARFLFELFLTLGTELSKDWIIYGKIGASIINAKLEIAGSDEQDLNFRTSKTKHSLGFVGGAGVSYAMTPAIIIGGEVLYRVYSPLKAGDIKDAQEYITYNSRVNLSGFVGRLTVSYKF